jgi:hypothetical protein
MDVVNENITQDYKYDEFVIPKQPYYYLGVLVILRSAIKKQPGFPRENKNADEVLVNLNSL